MISFLISLPQYARYNYKIRSIHPLPGYSDLDLRKNDKVDNVGPNAEVHEIIASVFNFLFISSSSDDVTVIT